MAEALQKSTKVFWNFVLVSRQPRMRTENRHFLGKLRKVSTLSFFEFSLNSLNVCLCVGLHLASTHNHTLKEQFAGSCKKLSKTCSKITPKKVFPKNMEFLKNLQKVLACSFLEFKINPLNVGLCVVYHHSITHNHTLK